MSATSALSLSAPLPYCASSSPPARSLPSSTVALELGRTLTAAIQIERVQPEPSRERAGADGGLLLEFEVAEPRRPALVQIFVKPKEIGLVEGTIGLRGQPSVRFTQFIYP
jgi:hypothetical protein